MIAGVHGGQKNGQGGSKGNANIPLAVPRQPIALNPFQGSQNKKSQAKNDPLLLEDDEVKIPVKGTYDKGRASQKSEHLKYAEEALGGFQQRNYFDNDKVEMLNTDNGKGEDTIGMKEQTLDGDKGQEEEQSGGFEDGLKTKAFYARFILIDQAVSSFSLLSIVIALIEYDLEFEEREDFIAKSMLWMTFILTLGMILMTVVRFQAKLEWLKTRKVISANTNLLTSGFMKGMILEIIISAVHPMPWTWNMRVSFFNEPQQQIIYYHINEILLLIMLLRGLLILRTLILMSAWYSNRTQRVCQMYACEANYLFVIKCIMLRQPYMLVTTAMMISIFYFGFAVRICEAPLQRLVTDQKLLFYSYYNCIWNIIVTMTTVGYGDYYAQTHLGRFVIFFVCIWGVLIVSLMVLTMNSTLLISHMECKAIAVLDRLDLKGQMKCHAAMVLTLLAKIGISNRRGQFEGDFKKQMQIKLQRALGLFKIAQRQYRSISDENVSEEMGRQFDFLRDDMKELYKIQDALLETNIQLMQYLKMDQQQIENFTKNLSRSSFQQIVLTKDEKNNQESSHYKVNSLAGMQTPITQNNINTTTRPLAVQEENSEKMSENDEHKQIFPSPF